MGYFDYKIIISHTDEDTGNSINLLIFDTWIESQIFILLLRFKKKKHNNIDHMTGSVCHQFWQ